GALIVAAAGNAGTGTLDYPARLANVVSVAAIDESGTRASFSNYGTGLDLSAPGARILTLTGNNGVPHYLQGTSFAAPFVTGAAALLLSVDPTLTNRGLWDLLNRTAVQPSGSGYNTNYGWGVVNVWNAVNALSRPFISVEDYPRTAARSSAFDIAWSVHGPAGTPIADTHVEWGTTSGQLGNSTTAQTGSTPQTFRASGLAMPSSGNAFYFKVVAIVNGTRYESAETPITVSNLPNFLFVLYQFLASNLLYLALFILALAAVVAFLPQRRAARARRATLQPRTMYPPNYYVQSVRTPPSGAGPPAASPGPPPTPPPIEFVRPTSPPVAPAAVQPPQPQPVAAKKRCPSCGTMVNVDNLFCFFCGNPFR
ncbi:MAG TPA: S8 family serine peptidase, partial [Thermoplasmata archaeon]|nr:S8 family serine peptidase [Thermoplasmata archaeon]